MPLTGYGMKPYGQLWGNTSTQTSYEPLNVCMTRHRVQSCSMAADGFRTTVGVRQWCLLSPTLFNSFQERIMCEALDDHEGSVSIGGQHYQHGFQKRDQDKRSDARNSGELQGSKPEILSRIAQTTAALFRLKIIWNISLASEVKLMRTLILSTFLYACESWTLTVELERRI